MTRFFDELERHLQAAAEQQIRIAAEAREAGEQPADAPPAAESVESRGRPWRRRRLSGRGLTIGLAALVVTGSAMAATVRLTSEPSKPKPYDVSRYLHFGGDAVDCIEIPSQAYAQAVLRADRSDPNHLDEGRRGIACPENPAPKDLTAVASIAERFRCRPSDARSASCPQPSRPFAAGDYARPGIDEYDCDQFASQADAQAVLRFEPDDPNRLDIHGDGIACPDLPAPKDLRPVATRASS